MSIWTRCLTKIGLNRPELRAWALYDVANSGFATTIMVAILPVYFHDSLAEELADHLKTAYWAYFNATVMIAVALVSPSLGYIADVYGAKKKFLASFTALGVIACCALAAVNPGQWLLAGLIFVVGCFAFFVANIFYESLLPHIAREGEIHRISNSGYALGYFGGGVLLAINLMWIMKPEFFGLSGPGAGIRLSFLSVALCWLLFSLPLLRNVAEPKTSNQNDRSVLTNSFHALFQLRHTFRELKKYPQVLLFLLAFWAYSDGIGTIMNMATIYGREVGIGASDLILAILLVQFLGVPCSFAFGPITDRLGAKKALMLAILVYLSISIVSYFMSAAWHFWILALGVASVQGGSQAISRSIFAEMVPLNHSGEFFGLFSVSSKFAGLFGPLIFGLLSEYSGGSRTSILFIIALFVLGLWLLSKLDIEAGKRQAQLANLEFQESPARII